jgi:hypothetical protein
LADFRRQLEADRLEVAEQIELVRERQDEVEELGRRTELELARERAMLSRERVQLDRLREEIRIDMERLQRESGARQALSVLQKLNDEIPERRRARETGGSDGARNPLRGLRS